MDECGNILARRVRMFHRAATAELKNWEESMSKQKTYTQNSQLELPVFADVSLSGFRKPKSDKGTFVRFFTDEDKRRIKCMNSSSEKYTW